MDSRRDDIAEAGTVVLAANINRDSYWPGMVIDEATAPEHVRRAQSASKVLINFYGPPMNQKYARDFCWVRPGELLPFSRLGDVQAGHYGRPSRTKAFQAAVQEALQASQRDGRPSSASKRVLYDERPAGRHPAAPLGWDDPDPDEEEEESEAPGDVTCCPVCDQAVQAGEPGTLTCSHCTFAAHAACDPLVHRAIARGEAGAFACPVCRQRHKQHEMIAGLRQVQGAIRDTHPTPARDAFEVFLSTARRHPTAGQYGEAELLHRARRTWEALGERDRVPYARLAAEEAGREAEDRAAHQRLVNAYLARRRAAVQAGVISEKGDLISTSAGLGPLAKQVLQRQFEDAQRRRGGAAPGGPSGADRGGGGAHSHALAAAQRAQRSAPRAPAHYSHGHGAGRPRKRQERGESPPYEAADRRSKKRHHSGGPATGVAHANGHRGVPSQIPIYCNDKQGYYHHDPPRVTCLCPDCGGREWACTQFENHAGAGGAKKWKASIRTTLGGVPDKNGRTSTPIGKWLEARGLAVATKRRRSAKQRRIELEEEYEEDDDVEEEEAPEEDPDDEEDLEEELLQQPARRATERAQRDASTGTGGGGGGGGANGGAGGSRAEPGQREQRRDAGPYEPWLDVSKGNYRPVKVRWAGDRCGVCDSDVDYDNDQLVSCDACGVTVHQSCYGVQELPGEADLWLCRACELKEEDGPAPQCCLCPVTGGPLKPTTEGLWCHAACMLWIPEVHAEDMLRMEPISHIRSISRDRWELLCCICKQRMGAKVQCSSCYTAYHPLCARVAGLTLEITEGDEGPEGPVRLTSYCPRHCTPRPERAGVQAAPDEDAPEGASGTELWNGQPFRQPPAVDLPRCSEGCARAQPLDVGWKRSSHGTGTGIASDAGFWIPGEPSPEQLLAARPRPPLRPQPLGAPALAAAQPHQAAAAGGAHRRQPQPGKRLPKDKTAAAKGEPPAAVTLLPLPPGCPELVPVVCAGRHAHLMLRAQRIVYEGQEMSASRFEQLCGKGDSKKWKSSLWLAGHDGQPVETMQDWLVNRQLDRKELTAFTANEAAVREFEEHVAGQVAEVTEALLEAVEVAALPVSRPAAADTPGAASQDGLAAVKQEASALKAEPGSRAEAGGPGEPQRPSAAAAVPTPAGAPAVKAEEGALQPLQQGPSSSGAAPAESRQPNSSTYSDPAAAGQPGGAAMGLTQQHPAEGPPASGAAQGVPVPSTPGAGAPSRGPPPPSAQGAEQQRGRKRGRVEEPPISLPAPDPAPGQGGLEAALRRHLLGGRHEGAASGQQQQAGLGADPQGHVGRRCRVFWPEDRDWYEGVVRGFNPSTGQHNVWYLYDEESEWLDVGAEAAAKRLRWLSDADPVAPSLLEPEVPEAGPPPGAPGEAVGRGLSVWWAEDARFYGGTVRAYDGAGKHQVAYRDGEVEWVDLARERVVWHQPQQPGAPGAAPLPPKPPSREPSRAPSPARPADQGPALTAVTPEPAGGLATVPALSPAPGPALELPAPSAAPGALVPGSASGPAPRPGPSNLGRSERAAARAQRAATPPSEDEADDGARAGPGSSSGGQRRRPPRGDVREALPIVCNGMRATFNVLASSVTLAEGREVTPTEFERLAGKANSKKWRASLRVDKGHGVPGQTLQDWLVEMGVEAQRAPRFRAAVGPRRQPGVVAAAGARSAPRPSSGPGGLQGHRENCLCIICKQGRRAGPTAAAPRGRPPGVPRPPGLSTAAAPPPVLSSAQLAAAATASAAAQAAPPRVAVRHGKRAFIRAVPQAPGGPFHMRASDVPPSRAFSAAEWAAEAAAAAQPGAQPALPAPDALEKVGGTDTPPHGAPGASRAAERRGPSTKERLEQALRTEQERLAFGKSGIHGWGLFALAPMRADTMVVEYRGDRLRREVANVRERAYKAAGKDCYLFTIHGEAVIDSTRCGTISRFTNHCCAPSLYMRVLEVDGQPRLMFYARHDIRPGQELTYDYRFKEEAAADKVPCSCGAPNCRGYLN